MLEHSRRSTLQELRASFIDRVRNPKQQQQQQSCPFCDPSTFPPLLAVFPRLRGVTVDVAANRDSGLIWKAFCKATVREKRRVWVVCTGIGEGVLLSEEKRLGMKVRIVDGKVRRVWEIVRGLERDEVRRLVEYGWRSEGVGEAMRVSERVADGLLRLIWYYEVDGREADDGGDESASFRAEAGSSMSDGEEEQDAPTATGLESPTARLHRWLGLSTHTEAGRLAVNGSDEHMMPARTDLGTWRPAGNEIDKHMKSTRTVTGSQAGTPTREQRIPTGTTDGRNPKRSLASRWDTCHWSRDFLAPLNWALRVWLKRESGEQDHEYVKIVEGREVRDVIAAEKMKAALLEEFSRTPQRDEFRAGV